MKHLALFATAIIMMAGCSDDNSTDDTPDLINPAFYMQVSTQSGDKPFTGVITVSPFIEGTSLYYGNYINQKISPFHGYYFVEEGAIFNNENNIEISLPTGVYDMVYWGTPQYDEPIYAHPSLREPSYSIGGDMANQTFSLLKKNAEPYYLPTYDLAYAKQTVNVGTDNLDASLHRVVAGLKVIIKDSKNEMLSSSISDVEVRISNIAQQLNFFTGLPQGDPCTVSFPLTRSMDGKQMTNGTVMLFPSLDTPELQVLITLKSQHVKAIVQPLSHPIKANDKLTLVLTIGEIIDEETSGEFTIEDWQESQEQIDVPILE